MTNFPSENRRRGRYPANRSACAHEANCHVIAQLNKPPTQTRFCFAVSTLMGGALGNVIDRLLHGHVVDFVQLHYGGWCFPLFNVADSAITLGAICLILDEILRVRRTR